MQTVIATLMRPAGDTGVQTHFNTFRRWLDAEHRDALLVTPFDAPRWQFMPVFGLRLIVDRLSKPWSVWWYRRWHAFFLRRKLRTVLLSGAPAVVYAQCPLSARAALASRVSAAQRVVLAVHFNVSQAHEWSAKGMLAAHHFVFRQILEQEADVLSRVDALVFVSDFMRREVFARVPAARDRPSTVIANFVDDPGDAEASQPADDLLCIGTLEPRKNQHYLLEIIAAAKRLGTDLRVTLIGDGPDRQALEARAVELGIRNLTSFAGRILGASKSFASHRACIHVASVENLPLTLIEALAHSRPIFACAAVDVPEVFDDGFEGRLLPLDDANAAARIVLQWWSDSRRLESAGLAARKRFERDFDTRILAARLAAFLTAPQHDD